MKYTYADMVRALSVVAMTDDARLLLFKNSPDLKGDAKWFLENVDEVVPELRKRGWIEHRPFNDEPGAVIVTTGRGDLRKVVITPEGRKQLREEGL